jgi:hypothetical protein
MVAGLRRTRCCSSFLAIIGTIVLVLTNFQKSPLGYDPGDVLEKLFAVSAVPIARSPDGSVFWQVSAWLAP